MEKLKNKGSLIYCALFIYLVASSFINHDVYAFTVRFASVVIFCVLGLIVLPYLTDDIRARDADLIMAFATFVLSVIFVLITGSGYGAIFIPTDLALIAYASKHIRPDRKEIKVISLAGAAPVILWYSHVRWSYNFNMAGFAFMIMAYFAMILTDLVLSPDGDSDKEKGRAREAAFFKVLIFATAFILSMLYHSRTAMWGMAMFIMIFALCDFMSTGLLLRRIVIFAATVGAVIFTGAYVLLASEFGSITLLYKDIFSGRQEIWAELWQAFAATPLTGIGSSHELKSFEIFEVHNGLFDILTVHGIPVFILVVILLWRMIEREGFGLHNDRAGAGLHNLGTVRRTALSAAFSMMFTSFFENYFTVPPYSVIFMTFLLVSAAAGKEEKGVS